MSKGQLFAADFSASVMIFSFFILFFGLAWNSSLDLFASERNILHDQGEYTFNILKTSGSPENWDSSDVKVPGLYIEGRLSERKVLELKNLSESVQRRLLKTQEFMLEVNYLNGSTVMENGENLTVQTSALPVNRSVYVHQATAVLREDRKRAELNYYTWQN
ncbi:MAG: hypothetical protein ABEJ95_00780 [Candidatus Nanohalobium sp.]